jgi:dihydrofolate reductase
MRKLVVCIMQTLDGFIAGPNGELDWHNVDEEYNDFSVEQLNHTGMLLFGRKTYELMRSYWTSEHAQSSDPVVAEKMNTIQKVVCSTLLTHADWNNTSLIHDHVNEKIAELKSRPGKDILIFGSAELAGSLTRCNLVDEFRIILTPVYIGAGKTLLGSLPESVHLQLAGTREFCSGKLLLHYQPITTC